MNKSKFQKIIQVKSTNITILNVQIDRLVVLEEEEDQSLPKEQ